MKLTLYFKSWHLTPTTAWCPIILLHPSKVRPGRSSPTTAPLPDKFCTTMQSSKLEIKSETFINFSTIYMYSKLTSSKHNAPQLLNFRIYGFPGIIGSHFQPSRSTQQYKRDQLKHPDRKNTTAKTTQSVSSVSSYFSWELWGGANEIPDPKRHWGERLLWDEWSQGKVRCRSDAGKESWGCSAQSLSACCQLSPAHTWCSSRGLTQSHTLVFLSVLSRAYSSSHFFWPNFYHIRTIITANNTPNSPFLLLCFSNKNTGGSKESHEKFTTLVMLWSG